MLAILLSQIQCIFWHQCVNFKNICQNFDWDHNVQTFHFESNWSLSTFLQWFETDLVFFPNDQWADIAYVLIGSRVAHTSCCVYVILNWFLLFLSQLFIEGHNWLLYIVFVSWNFAKFTYYLNHISVISLLFLCEQS